MSKLARTVCLAVAALTIAGTAFAQDYTRVRPRWNQFGSAICPEGYDYYRGWCRLRGNEPPREYGYGRSPRYGYGGLVPPQWNSRGSAVCPELYDYYGGWCRPRVGGPSGNEYAPGQPPAFGYGGRGVVPPQWNGRGSAVCPEMYDYYRGWCRPREYSQDEREPDNARPAEYGYGRGVPPQWDNQGSAVCPDNYDYRDDMTLCVPRE